MIPIDTYLFICKYKHYAYSLYKASWNGLRRFPKAAIGTRVQRSQRMREEAKNASIRVLGPEQSLQVMRIGSEQHRTNT